MQRAVLRRGRSITDFLRKPDTRTSQGFEELILMRSSKGQPYNKSRYTRLSKRSIPEDEQLQARKERGLTSERYAHLLRPSDTPSAVTLVSAEIQQST